MSTDRKGMLIFFRNVATHLWNVANMGYETLQHHLVCVRRLVMCELAGRFPGDGGFVAPGMSCKYMVRFAPESLGGYEDFITVETQGEDVLVVPIRAERHPPVLTCESRSHSQEL